MDKIMNMLKMMSQQLDEEKQHRIKAESELTSFKSQMAALSQQLADSVSNQNPVLPDQNTPPCPPPTPSAPLLPNLLLGTSLLRNVDATKLNNWKVKAKGGSTIEDLHKMLNEVSDNQSFDEMIIVGGSIDLETKNKDEIVADYQALAVSASSMANKVKFTSILPRTDKNLKDKTMEVNNALKEFCDEVGHTFIDIDPSFHLMSGDVNDAFLVHDGLHLSKKGLDNLMFKCGVIKHGSSAFTPKKYPSQTKSDALLFKGHKHPLSNFFPVNVSAKGKQFNSTEAAYQHAKAEFMGDFNAAKRIQSANTGLKAMLIASKIETNDRWRNKKVDVMESLVKQKISVCDKVRSTLLNSGSREIIEDTEHEFWGRGRFGKGENKLGKIWMKFRLKLKEDPNFVKKTDQPTLKRTGSSSHQRKWATRNSQPRCYHCGEPGHVMQKCRQQDTVSCWGCGVTGHKRKHCDHFSRQPRYRGYDGYTQHESGRYEYAY